MQVLSVGNRSRRVESIAGWQAGDSAVLWSRERGGGRASLSQIWHPSKHIRELSFRRGEIFWKYLRVSLFWSMSVAESQKTFLRVGEIARDAESDRKKRKEIQKAAIKEPSQPAGERRHNFLNPILICGHPNTNLTFLNFQSPECYWRNAAFLF